MNASIKIVANKQEYAYCAGLRTLVYVHEQKCDLGYEFDEHEEECTHYLMKLKNEPIATARYRMVENDIAKIERIVVLKEYRKRGYGSTLVSHVTEDVKLKPNVKKIIMSAQDHALSFYEKLGYEVVGEGYMEADIPHHKVIKEVA